MTIDAYPIWRLRLRRGLPRYALIAVAGFGIAASARFAIAPPRAVSAAGSTNIAPPADLGAEAYAVQFARRYLTLPRGPGSSLVNGSTSASGGLEPEAAVPAGVEQRVLWAEVVQAREPAKGQHVYTVAAQTDSAGLLYLTVTVSRLASGSLALVGYPAFVGAPASAAAPATYKEATVEDAQLEVVIRRALANYLSASGSELAADLAPGAHVSLPPNALTLESIQRPTWAPGGAVEVVSRAIDARGIRYTLAYEVDVARERGRWEISAIQTDPRS